MSEPTTARVVSNLTHVYLDDCVLTLTRFTPLPTSNLEKKRSMLAPIFSYDGTGAWISKRVFPSFADGLKPDGKQHMNATEPWPSGVCWRRNRSSSTVSPSTRKADSISPEGMVGKTFLVTRFSNVDLSLESLKRVGKRTGRCSVRRYV